MDTENEDVQFQPNHDAEVPVCLECATPVSPLEYYCPKCGAASGQLTPTLPFVNIRYHVSFYTRLWHQIWSKEKTLVFKIIGWLVLILLMPIILIALPFKLLGKQSQVSGDTDALCDS